MHFFSLENESFVSECKSFSGEQNILQANAKFLRTQMFCVILKLDKIKSKCSTPLFIVYYRY